jgi:hypothetical protein
MVTTSMKIDGEFCTSGEQKLPVDLGGTTGDCSRKASDDPGI